MDLHPRWTLGIADPSLIGWMTVAAYLICALLLARAARRGGAERHLWWLAMLLVLALGINKQLDLQTLLTQTMRDGFVRAGLYEWRRQAQALFVAAAVIGAGGSGMMVYRIARRSGPAVRQCMAGAAILVIYVLMRLANIYHAGIPGSIAGHASLLPPIMEFAGIALMAWSTLLRHE